MGFLSRSYILWPLILLVMLLLVFNIKTERPQDISYDEFLNKLNAGEIAEAVIEPEALRGVWQGPEKAQFVTSLLSDTTSSVKDDITRYNEAHPENQVSFRMKSTQKWWMSPLATMILTVGLFALLWIFVMRQIQSGGAKAMSFGKVRAKLHPSHGVEKTTFQDVAGCDEAKEELQEVIEFLKEPERFRRLGGKIPKGVLLLGPPGTGKTLLAKAVAGEAEVPFFSISGSDFVEMFVGVGASRVRDLFETGKRNAPCIIFVDEIDAVGRHRFAGWGGGHDEREQTLNQLLVELDGFTPNDNVILIAATNRPDVLDPALLRPGRFDRRIVVDLPDQNGREEVLKVHTRQIKLAGSIDLGLIAKRTPGFSGADIANACNEAALLAARKNKEGVELSDFEEAIDRVLAGPERHSRAISDPEKRIIAYHESGHALLASLLDEVDPVHKVSIVSRGHAALGYTLQVPEEDKYLVSKKELIGRITVMFGGRVAEELEFNEITTGAHNDLHQATDIAHRMVTDFGMSEQLGPRAFTQSDHPVFLGRDFARERPYSEATAFEIDKEVRQLVDSCYGRARDLLVANRDKLDRLAKALLEKEVMDRSEVEAVLEAMEHDATPEAETETKQTPTDQEDTQQ